MEFSIASRYELLLSWDKVSYNRPGVCSLSGAKFSGNALKISLAIPKNDSIKLDFYKQYYSVVTGIYVATLAWGDVEYKDNNVLLKNASIKHDTQLNIAPKFKSTDRILIDTQDHEEKAHRYSFVYKSYVVNEDGQLYKFDK